VGTSGASLKTDGTAVLSFEFTGGGDVTNQMVGEPGVWWGQPGGQTQLENLLLE